MPNIVLVADMIRGFCEPRFPLYVEGVRDIIPRIQELLRRELAQGSKIIYLCDHHSADDPEFRMFPPHCVAGTAETEVIPELARFPGTIVHKTRFSGFFGTDLDKRLEEEGPEKIAVCGDCTSICILFTVADARYRGYPVDVYKDCVADFDPEAHRFALRHMEKVLGARVISLED